MNSQKKILLSYYNSCEGDPASFQSQTNLNANPASSSQKKNPIFPYGITYYEEDDGLEDLIAENDLLGIQPILLDDVTFEEIIDNPLMLKNYWWRYDGIGAMFPGYPLEVACKKGWKEMVSHLLDKKHLFPISRARSLCNAIEKDNHEIVQLLIQAGVSVTECTITEKRNIHYESKK